MVASHARLTGTNKKINRSKLAHSVFTLMYLIYYLVHDQKILAKQVRVSRVSVGLQVKWRQVLK